MPTPSFEDSDVHYAYSTIHNFFEVFSMHDAILYVESSLLAATSNKVWKWEVPAHLLFFVEKLQALCNAAYTIHYDITARKGTEVEPQEDGIPDIAVTGDFMDSNFRSNGWNNFPRSLSARQYHYPYKAIAKFCNYMAAPEWAFFFKELIEFCLSKSRIDDDDYHLFNILKIRRRLLQLIEACHLMEMRRRKNEAVVKQDDETKNS